MNQKQFLDELDKHLNRIPASDREEILQDQKDFIRDALSAGRDEREILEKLGSPKDFASSVLADYKFHKIKTADGLVPTIKAIIGSLGTFIILTPFNIVVLFIPLLVLFVSLTLMISFGIASFAIGFAGFIVFLVSLGKSLSVILAVLFGSVGFIGIGLILTYLFGFLLSFSLRQIILYISWNLNFVKRNRIKF